MRTYGQFCAVAKALDIVGDRWTLLIVREMLTLGPCRHTDLRNGLPGIASNLLVDRLRDLEEAGLIRREAADPPIATTLFILTDRGRALEPVLHALGEWGGPLVREPVIGDSFRTHWLALPVRLHLADRAPYRPPIEIELRTDDEYLTIEVDAGGIHTRPGQAEDPAVSLDGPAEVLASLIAGVIGVHTARIRGLTVEGDLDALTRVLPPEPIDP